MSYVESCKLALLGLDLKADILNNPLVEGSMVFKLDGAKRVCDSLKRVLDGVRIVIERIETPLVALSMVINVNDSVDRRVSQIDVRRCHIDLCAKGLRTIFKLAISHSLKEIKVFFNTTISVRAVLSGLGKRATISSHFVCVKIANVSLTFLDELYGKLIALLKVVRAIEYTAGRLASKPLEILVNALNVFVVLF